VIKVEDDLAYIATASHVIEGDEAPRVEFFQRRNRTVKAQVVRTQGGDRKGLALLAVRGADSLPARLRALPFGASADVSAGQELWIIGFGQGQGDWGVIRATVVSLDGADFKLDGRIEEGNSGGPVLRSGQVVALITSDSHGFGLAKPSLIVEATMKGWGVVFAPAEPVEQQAATDGAAQPSTPTPVERTAPSGRYLLAGSSLEPGRIVQENGKFEVRDGTLMLNVGGVQVPPGRMTLVHEQAGRTEILAASGGRVTKLRRTIDKMNRQIRRTIGGEEEREDVSSPLEGRTVVAERDGNGWRITQGGDLFPPDAQRELNAVLDTDWGYPTEAVPIGHRWTLTGDQLSRFLGLAGIAVNEGEANFALKEIKQCGAERCAAIDVRLRVSGMMLDEVGNPMFLSMDGTGQVLRSLKHRVDVEHALSGRMEMNASVAAGATPIGMSLSGPFDISGKATVK
jgi:hypothetical protein